jgi:hypothetical protein
MDFELGHTYNRTHTIKEANLKNMEQVKLTKYKDQYNRLGFAFAPLVTNSFGQFGADLLRFLWLLANFAARNQIPVQIVDRPNTQSTFDEDETQKSAFKILRSKIFTEFKQKIQTEVYEGIAERVFGRTHSLQANPQYRQFFATHRSMWTPELLAMHQGSSAHQDGIIEGSRTSTWVLGNPSPRRPEDVDEERVGTQQYHPSSHIVPSPSLILSGEMRATSYVGALVVSGRDGV